MLPDDRSNSSPCDIDARDFKRFRRKLVAQLLTDDRLATVVVMPDPKILYHPIVQAANKPQPK